MSGLACPECSGFGLHENRATCNVCDGTGLVTLEQIEAWRARQRERDDYDWMNERPKP
jgi:DnaJ-class molecular chaperone